MVAIRQPSPKEDRPGVVSTSVVGALALGAGLWLAHLAMGHPAPEAHADEGSEPSFASPPSESESESESEGEVEGEAEVEDEAEGERELDGDSAQVEGEGQSEAEVEVAPPSSATPIALAPPPSVPPRSTPRGSGPVGRARHGRVAYLRCDGAPPVAGPFPCPRDAALEATVWAAIDQSLACQPPLPPGQADLVVELDRTIGPAFTISTRDTFPDEAVRTDAAAVVACLAPALADLTTTIPGDRIRVGFRFELE